MHWQAAEDRVDASKRMIPLPSPAGAKRAGARTYENEVFFGFIT